EVLVQGEPVHSWFDGVDDDGLVDVGGEHLAGAQRVVAFHHAVAGKDLGDGAAIHRRLPEHIIAGDGLELPSLDDAVDAAAILALHHRVAAEVDDHPATMQFTHA